MSIKRIDWAMGRSVWKGALIILHSSSRPVAVPTVS